MGHFAAKTIQGAASLAEQTTVAAVKTTGQVTASTAKAVISTSGTVAGSLASTAGVTFKDTATGLNRQVPYQEGLRLYAASQSAKLGASVTTLQLMRQGLPAARTTRSSLKPGTANDVLLKRRDVIKVSRAAL